MERAVFHRDMERRIFCFHRGMEPIVFNSIKELWHCFLVASQLRRLMDMQYSIAWDGPECNLCLTFKIKLHRRGCPPSEMPLGYGTGMERLWNMDGTGQLTIFEFWRRRRFGSELQLRSIGCSTRPHTFRVAAAPAQNCSSVVQAVVRGHTPSVWRPLRLRTAAP